jgi:hypothetical protein
MTAKELERIAILETKMQLLSDQVTNQGKTLQEVHNAVVASKGARLALLALVSVSGTIGGLISTFIPRG